MSKVQQSHNLPFSYKDLTFFLKFAFQSDFEILWKPSERFLLSRRQSRAEQQQLTGFQLREISEPIKAPTPPCGCLMIFNEKAFLHLRERSLYKDLEILWGGYENQRKERRISCLF